jgi:hypothetical protein
VPISLCLEESCPIFATRVSAVKCPKVSFLSSVVQRRILTVYLAGTRIAQVVLSAVCCLFLHCCTWQSRPQPPSTVVSNLWHLLPPSTRDLVVRMTAPRTLTSAPIAHHVDAIMTRLCHGTTTVCAEGADAPLCLGAADAAAIIAAGDAEFFDRYARPYSKVVMFPFFHDLANEMLASAEGRYI